jgi:hypothetical protein
MPTSKTPRLTPPPPIGNKITLPPVAHPRRATTEELEHALSLPSTPECHLLAAHGNTPYHHQVKSRPLETETTTHHIRRTRSNQDFVQSREPRTHTNPVYTRTTRLKPQQPTYKHTRAPTNTPRLTHHTKRDIKPTRALNTPPATTTPPPPTEPQRKNRHTLT